MMHAQTESGANISVKYFEIFQIAKRIEFFDMKDSQRTEDRSIRHDTRVSAL